MVLVEKELSPFIRVSQGEGVSYIQLLPFDGYVLCFLPMTLGES